MIITISMMKSSQLFKVRDVFNPTKYTYSNSQLDEARSFPSSKVMDFQFVLSCQRTEFSFIACAKL